MKPVKLTMQAFLSYKGKEEIDFSRLNGKLFLIDGITGAGKTSIFDAMCFALYGQASNAIRESKTFKSDYADIDTTCFVEFTFIQNGKEYTIYREPEQYRHSKRKNKNGTHDIIPSSSVQVLTYDNKSLTKFNDVSTKIKEILKLDLNQFRQTMMIAQGKFSELVQANTDTRSDLFREILNTSSFETFENNLKEEASRSKADIEMNNNSINSKLEGFVANDEELIKILNNNPALYDYDKLKEMLDNQLESDYKKMLDDKNQHENINNQVIYLNKEKNKIEVDNDNFDKYFNHLNRKKELDIDKEKYNKLSKLIDDYKDSKIVYDLYDRFSKANEEYKSLISLKNQKEKELEELTPKYKKSYEDYLKIDSLNKENEEINNKIGELKKQLDSFKDYSDKQKEIMLLKIKSEKLNKELIKFNDEKTNLNNEKENLNKFISDNENIVELRLNIKNESDDINSKLKELEDIKEEYLIYKIDINNLKQSEDEALKLERRYSSDNLSHAKLLDEYLKDQAGLLAANLKENEPCPVCGSKIHIKLAKSISNITKKDVDIAEEIKNKSLNEFNDFKRKYEIGKNKLELQFKNLTSKLNKLLNINVSDFENNLFECEQSLNEKNNDCNLRMNQINLKIKKVKESKSKIIEIEDSLKNIDSNIANCNENINKYNNDNSRLQGEIKTLENAINGKSEVELSNLKESYGKAYKDNKTLIEEYNNTYQELNRLKSSLEVLIESYKNDLPKKLNSLNEYKEKYNKALSESRLKDINGIKELINKYNINDIKSSEKDYNDYISNVKTVSMLLEDDCNNNYDKIKKIDLTEIQTKINEISSDLNQKMKNYTNSSNIYSTNKKIIESYEYLYNSIKSKSKLTFMLKELSDVANGQVIGKEKIDFETYYQSQIFGNILKIASNKLSKMTDGRYSMYRHVHDDIKDKTLRNSLDIDIFDTSTGKLRSSKSLSGGETFMTSLALALGFSEIIRNESGAMELDCMFIDEGFGSLDNESLHSVLNVLKNLSNENERMIGIISHVEELEYEISNKIKVVKDLEGSHLNYIID